ncbi:MULTISPECIES: hypothetical protein [unclassified Gordonia (in: high G+C Gram-positive bacteria)]
MSTYGFALIADVANVDDAERVVAQSRAALGEDWDPQQWGFDPFDGFASEVTSGDGAARVSVVAERMLPNSREAQFFAGIGDGRAALCEDLDEYGVMFSVWRLNADGAQCVYRAHVHDPDSEPAPGAIEMMVTGPDAAAAAADLYDADASAFLALEQDPSPVAGLLGIVGSPFETWLSALGLRWPEIQ